MLSVPQEQVRKESYVKRATMGETFIITHTENQYKKLESITIPTILIWGESDKKVLLDQAKLMKKKLVRATLATLPGGHAIIYRNPKEVARLIKVEVDKLDKQAIDW